MDKKIVYISIWSIMVAATFVEIYIFTTALSAEYKAISIMILAALQAVTNAAFFMNLRYEKKVISLLPLLAIITITTLIITALLSVGR